MHSIVYYLSEVLDFLRIGFSHVNAILGIMIAFFAAFMMSDWKKLWEIALASTLVHIVAMVLIPVIDHHANIVLPNPVTADFWRDALALYVGYVILISVFFFIRSKLLKGGKGGGH